MEEYVQLENLTDNQTVERVKQIERSLITTYRKSIYKPFISAVKEFELVNENDKIAVCISGGKDSMLMAKCMQELHRHGTKRFDIEFIVMDPGYNPQNRKKIEENAQLLGVPIKIFSSNIFDSVADVTKGNPCYLCARMRRGNLYAYAKSLGCNKIALGHHFNDVIETTLMSILYNGTFKTMVPKLKSKNFEGLELIRPMYKVKEKDILNWVNYNKLTFINCACRFTEACSINSDDLTLSKRKEAKHLISTLKKMNPIFDDNIMRSLYNVNLHTVLGWEYKGKKHPYTTYYDQGSLDE